VEHDTSAGRLGKQGFDEDKIDAANRIPRITAAVWQYESGAVGTLMHSVALHGKLCTRLVVRMGWFVIGGNPDATYDTEIEIIADGYRLKLVDPYNAPVLYIRRPGLAGEGTYLIGGPRPRDWCLIPQT
jgi:hypothetical protein